MTVETLKTILRQIKRRSQPRVAISVDVFSPSDRRAVRLELGR